MKNIKTLMLGLLLIVACTLTLNAQNNNRTAETKIVDALNQLPADNQKLYDSLMADIASTGEQGLQMLLGMLQKNDESLTKVQYALNAYAAYAGENNFDAKQRQMIVDNLKKTIEAIDVQLSGNPFSDIANKPALVTNKELLVRMMKQLAQYPSKPADAVVETDVKVLTANMKAAAAAVKKNNTFENRAKNYAALREYIQGAGIATATKTIVNAMKQPCREYRAAAINAVNEGKEGADAIAPMLAEVTKALPKLSAEAKVDVLKWLAMYPQIADTKAIVARLADKDNSVVEAAAWALTRIGKAENINDVAAIIASTDAQKVALAEACLKAYSGNVTDAATATGLSQLTANGQVAVLNIIAARKDKAKKDIVTSQLTAADSNVKKAAYAALKAVSTKSDLNSLYTTLEAADKEYMADVQDAIVTVLSEMEANEQYNTIAARKDAVQESKQALYWPIVFRVADNSKLLDICRNLQKEGKSALLADAFSSYMVSISNKLPGAQQLLMYENAMQFAQNNNQKAQVLGAVAKTKTFLGLIFLGKYIENPELQQAAAQAIRTLAVNDETINGPEVKALLKRAKEVITGGDAGYQKTEIEQQLEKRANDEGFVSMFNGKDLTGWKGLLLAPYDNPIKRATLKAAELAKRQQEANESMNRNWTVEDGNIIFSGKGESLATEKQYGNFEMYVDWKLYPGPEPDAGIYLRGAPQVQIWDIARTNVGAQVGSGGLYNNKINESKPLKVADNALGEWNSFYIKMVDECVTVYLNGELVVDNVVMENYWDRSLPIFWKEQIELQAHGSRVAYRNLYIRELPQAEPITLSKQEKKEGFKLLFDGTSLNNFQGDKVNYSTENGTIAVRPVGRGFGNLYTNEEYSDFIFRFEFKLTEGANNGIGIRAEMGKDAAYYGMEIQVLDHYNKIYQPGLHDYQYHGSVYGIIPTQNRDQLKPVGEWNEEEIYAKGDYIRVTLNGVVITEGNIREATKNGNYDKKEHPGLFNKKGYIGFLGHGSTLWYRNVRVKALK